MMPVNIDFNALNIGAIAPAFITIFGALVILVLDLIKKTSKQFNTLFTMLTCALALLVTLGMSLGQKGFFGFAVVDGVSVLAQLVILLASLMFIPLGLTSKRFHEFEYPEFYTLFLFVVAGFQIMVSTTNLALIFVGLETASLALYTLIAMHNRDRSIEAALKYFTMGSLAAGFLAFGLALFYLAGGSLDIPTALSNLNKSGFANYGILLAGLAFLLSAFAFKLSIVPLHTWTPDVYEGASAPLAGYMSIVPKIAGFVIMIRLFEPLVQMDIPWVRDMLLIAAVATMTLGNILALVQESVKRMLAFSSISHAGFGLVAILLGTTEANASLFLYWTLYAFANFGAFSMLWLSRHKNKIFHDRYDHPYTKFSGMVYLSPIGAIAMAIFMLSLAGVPPFGLFWGKFYMISATMAEGYIFLALIMVLNSAIAVYYYVKLIIYMFLKEPSQNDRTIYYTNVTTPFKIIIGIATIASVCAIFGVNPILKFIYAYLHSSGF
jgi:NADH-quinone oxidoreductase subunit N